MIDLELWRARIGLFQGRLIARALRKSAASASAGKKARAKAAPDSQGLRSAVAVAAVVNLLMILLTATTIASKLLMAGDVEPNPGPETRGPLGQDAHPLHVSVRPKEVQVFLLYCVHRTNHFRYKDVLQLADFLYKCGGIQCKFDGYDRSNPAPPNWSLWVEKMICESDYVLMVCSEALLNALQSSSHEFVSMQRGKFYADAIANIVRAPKFIPIFLNARECLDWVPMSLQAATSYELKVEELCNEMGNTEGVSLRIFNKRLEEHLHNEKYKGIASLVAQLRKEPLTVTPPQTPEVASTPCSSIQSSKPFPKPDPLDEYSTELKTRYDEWELSDALTKFPQFSRNKYEYINLALIGRAQDEEVREHKKDITKTTIHGNIDDIPGSKTAITFDDVASSGKGRLILIEGAPGIGKTSFAWKLCKKWASGEIYSQYKLVVFLKLRDKKVRMAKEISDLFYLASKETIQEIKETDGKGVLMLLEGYDELSTEMRTDDSIFLDIISGDELGQAKVIVTSRPTASEFLLARCKNQISQHIEILGFTSENIEAYLQTVLANDQDLLVSLKGYLTCYPHIQNMLYIPLNCAIIIEVYRQCVRANTEQVHVPKTMTELYSSFLRTLLLRHLHNHPVHRKLNWSIPEFRDLPDEVYKEFYHLAKVAFDGILKERQVIFELPSDTETLGLMHCVPEVVIDKGIEKSFSFLHLTIQEYLAAFYLSQMPTERLQELILDNRRESSFQMVLRFFAGLTKFKSFKSVPVLQQCFKYDDSVDEARVSLGSLHWIFEAQDPTLAIRALGRSVRFVSQPPFSIFDCFVLGYCISHSECLWDIKLSEERLQDEGVKLFVQGALEDSTKCSSGGISDLELNLKITSEGLNHLLRLPDEYLKKTLKALDLRSNNLGPEACSMLCQSIPEMPCLEVIRLDSNPVGCGSGELVSLVELLTSNSSKYTGVYRYLSSTLPLPYSVSPLSGLKVLDLGNAGLHLEHCKALKELLGSTRTLRDLFVVDNKLSPECLDYIIDGVSQNNSLFCLEMRGSYFSVENAKHLASVLESNSILIHVGLSSCNISAESACFLANALCENDSLLKLYLDRNPIGSKGANAFAAMLHRNVSLKKLDVCDNSIGEDGASNLASALAHNSTLENLWIPDMFESVLKSHSVDRIKFLYLQRKKWMNEKWGDREGGDQQLYQERIRKEYRYQPEVYYTSHTFRYRGTSSTVITCIEANDCWDDGTGGEPSLIDGGLGESFVNVQVIGQLMNDFEHTITIYGKVQHQIIEESEHVTDDSTHKQPSELDEASSMEVKYSEESKADTQMICLQERESPETVNVKPQLKQLKLEYPSEIKPQLQFEPPMESCKDITTGHHGNDVFTTGDTSILAKPSSTWMDTILGDGDFDDITECLEALMDDEKTIYSLGITLNLKQKTAKELREQHSDTFLDDIITAWLEQTDRPTWRSMLKALRHRRVRRNSLADQIAKSKGFGYEDMHKQPSELDKAPSVEVKHSEDKNLRGMEVFAETRFIVKGRHSQTFKWEGYGLKLSIPEGAILSESVIYIKVGLAGQFELPPGAQLVSPIYWLYCDNDFQHPITLELQHCSSIKNQSKNSSLCFIVAECSQQELPYKFKFLDEGTFSQHSPHGSVEVEHFSLFGLVEKFVRLFVHSQPPRSCFAQLFYLDKGENAWQLDFIITWNLELYLTCIKQTYSKSKKAVEGPHTELHFEESISLAIPENGITKNGWTITPLNPQVITKQQVDGFKPGQRIPCCQLEIRLLTTDNPEILNYKLTLEGAKKPFDFLYVTCTPVDGTVHGRKRPRQLEGNQSEVDGTVHGRKRPRQSEGNQSDGIQAPTLENLLDNVRIAKWFHLGVKLGIRQDALEVIERDRRCDTSGALMDMLRKWLQVCEDPTWVALVSAMREIGEGNCAKKLEDKFC